MFGEKQSESESASMARFVRDKQGIWLWLALYSATLVKTTELEKKKIRV